MSQSTALCKWSEYECKKQPAESGFCKKHYRRGMLLQEANARGVRICDDGKRACRNPTQNNKVKCEECYLKIRQKEKAQYNERKELGNVCLACGIAIDHPIIGNTDKEIMKCEICYQNERKSEMNRGDRIRNFGLERKLNPERQMREYITSAANRNIQFELNKDEFIKITSLPCSYCGYHNPLEPNGIDRKNSSIGYIQENIVAACRTCNFMKHTLSVRDFAEAICKIYNFFAKSYIVDSDEEESTKDALPSYKIKRRSIVQMYCNGELAKFIDLCEKDNRSTMFIEKMKNVSGSLTGSQFLEYLKNALRSDSNQSKLTNSAKRQRVPMKEICGLLSSNRYNDAAVLYKSVHGDTPGIKTDMKQLASNWNTQTPVKNQMCLNSLLIKYNNARARGCDTIVDSDSESDTEAEIKNEIITVAPITTENKVPTQWKVSNILSAFEGGKEQLYKSYLETMKDIQDLSDWQERWATFVNSMNNKTKMQKEKIIKEFILMLRTIRHNALCYRNNEKKILEKDDRQIWKNDTILHAFNSGDLSKFKLFTEESSGDDPNDPVWSSRWDEFVISVTSEKDITKRKTLITNFLAAQRMKKYRKNRTNKSTTTPHTPQTTPSSHNDM